MTNYRRATVRKVTGHHADPSENPWKVCFMIAANRLATLPLAYNYYRTHAEAIDVAQAWAENLNSEFAGPTEEES